MKIQSRHGGTKLKNKNGIVVIDSLKVDQKFLVYEGEKKTFFVFLINGRSENGEIKIVVEGQKAEVKILGIILGFGEQKIELLTLQDHQKENSMSDLFIKAVLFDKAKLFYKGLIKIEKEAQKSNAYQKNQTILMSDDSWVDSKPYLEILADDVRCTHGASVGRLNEEQLYYLLTRGINRQTASKLLIEGFLKEVIDRIPDKNIQTELERKIMIKINQLLKAY